MSEYSLDAVIAARARCQPCGKFSRPVVRLSLGEIGEVIGLPSWEVLTVLHRVGAVKRSGRWLLPCEHCGYQIGDRNE